MLLLGLLEEVGVVGEEEGVVVAPAVVFVLIVTSHALVFFLCTAAPGASLLPAPPTLESSPWPFVFVGTSKPPGSATISAVFWARSPSSAGFMAQMSEQTSFHLSASVKPFVKMSAHIRADYS